MLLDQSDSSHISIHSRKSPSTRHPTTNPSSPAPNSHNAHPHTRDSLWDNDPETAYLSDLQVELQRLERHQ